MSDILWTINELLQATGGELRGASSDGVAKSGVTGISIDTRSLKSGELYVAIRGDRLDGHDYVAAAFDAGAGACLVSSDWAGLDDRAKLSGSLIVVEDSLEGMGAIGRAARARSHGKIIAVTGSVGKTGTKEALKYCLSSQGIVHGAEKSFNNHWGVPLTLSRMPSDTEFGIFEIGMNHPGEIRPLVKMVRPHIAIITTVEPVHLGFFKSVEEIAQAKAEIFEGIEPGGIAVLNRDNPYFEQLAKRAVEVGVSNIATFGAHESCDMRVVGMDLDATGSDVTASYKGETFTYRLGTAGRHIVQNSLGVLLGVALVGGDVLAAASALGDIGPQKGRGARQIFKIGGESGCGSILVIDESYNANPASMSAALEAMAGTPKAEYPRRIAVLGDMLELGEASTSLHQGLARHIDEAEIDIVFAAGPFMKSLFEALPPGKRGAYALNGDEICTALIDEVRAGDIVMVKGSLGSRMGPVVAALEDHLKEISGNN